jgi:8-oxo-dGTP pyrophosphatase MutT (NUDIX family)
LNDNQPVPQPRPASTVVLARPASGGFQVFLVRRHDSIAFMGGAHVFPGGRVDEADHTSDAEAWCDGVPQAIASLTDYSPGQAIAFHVAAARELFEEAGVLLARDGGGMVAIDERDTARVAALRREMSAHRLTMRGLVERDAIRLALDALVLFAHWVTPEIETRRFDTQFFFAIAPEAQQAAHDEEETTEGIWMDPAEALDRCRRGAIALPPPTWTTLRALSALPTIDAARAWAAAQRAPRVQPNVIERADGSRIIALPGDPLCPPVDGFEAPETRFVLSGGRWQPVDPD